MEIRPDTTIHPYNGKNPFTRIPMLIQDLTLHVREGKIHNVDLEGFQTELLAVLNGTLKFIQGFHTMSCQI